MKYFVTFLFLSCVTVFSSADRIEDVNKYIDEVLSVHVPWAIEAAGLEVYQMPDFENNFQNRSHDGTAITGKLIYHSGNLTGLQSVHRAICTEPEWTSGNSTFYCNIVFPQITVVYTGRLQLLTSVSNNARFRQRVFSVKGETTDMEAKVEVTSSPYLKVPTIKSLTIVNNGKPSFRFDFVEEVSFETLSSHFYSKYNKIFRLVFDDLYRKAFERAIESLPYPF